MGNRQSQNSSLYDPPIENSPEYGDEYPVILCEHDIESEKKRILKALIQDNKSIKVCSGFHEALKFTENLGISFILIFTSDYDEEEVIDTFQRSGGIYGRPMFDIEEEAILKDLFSGASHDLIKSLDIKAYFFITHEDLKVRLPYDENEEEVMLMREVKDMAKMFQQESIIIWYDPHLQHEVKTVIVKKFDIEERNIYHDFEELWKRIHNVADLPFHLILTGKDEALKIVEEIANLKDLLCLYIYCDDPQIMQRKKRNILIEETIEKLVPRITQGIRTKSKLINSLPVFTTHFDAYDKSHIYDLHYYLRGLLNFQNRKQAKNDFLLLAKRIYESKRIFEFEREYDEFNLKEIFKWYSMESPVYKLLNNCLRVATSDSILYCRFILKDLERAIREQYHEGTKNFNGLVYRGAYITKEEWEKLEHNVGKNIEMYGFLSTSEDIEVAKNFLFSDLQNKILITIIVPPLPTPELNEQGFANISKTSRFKEAEILFNVRSKFRILEAGMTQIDNKGNTCRHLVLFYGPQLLRRYMTHYKPVINLNLKLPSQIKCATCGSSQNLFGFNQGGTKVSCMKCVRNGFIPKDTPLLALESETRMQGERVIQRSFKGKKLAFQESYNFQFYGYKCNNCKEMGKEVYYKWINLKREEVSVQCSGCFQNEKDMKADILLMESKPYIIWQESQSKAEIIDDQENLETSQLVKQKMQSEVYFEAKRFDLCLKYENEVIKKLARKRWRELERLESLRRMALTNQKSGNFKEALRYFLEDLSIRKILYGNKHAETATSHNNIGRIYFEHGQYQEALVSFRKALDIRKTIFGEMHSETVVAYSNIATTYNSLKQYPEALEYHRRALEIKKSISGERHSEFATIYSNYALTLTALGRHQEALDFSQKALEIKEIVFGEMHPETAAMYNNAAARYEEDGQYQEALKYQKKALEISKTISGEKHPETMLAYTNYASTLMKVERFHEVLVYNKKLLDIRLMVFGDTHPKTALSYNSYGLTLVELGKYEVALDLLKKALMINKTMFGDKQVETAISYRNIGLAKSKLGQHKEALELYKKALEIMKTSRGERHPDTAMTYNDIAFVYDKLGLYGEALECFKKALDIGKLIFRDKHPDLIIFQENCASFRKKRSILENV